MKTINIKTEEDIRKLWPLVVPTESCWHWKGHHDSQSYSIHWLNGVAYKGHRIVYTFVRGAIPNGKVLDHLCRNRWCVNPFHLEAVTAEENTRRGESPWVVNARRTHCKNGHAFAGHNVRLEKNGTRACRTCKRAQNRAWAARKRAAELSEQRHIGQSTPA